MSYSLVTPCNNYPSPKPEGQKDCLMKDTCLDKCKIEEAISSIHHMGEAHKGGGTITLDCFNKRTAPVEGGDTTSGPLPAL